MAAPHDILVRGTGAVGMAAALALSRQGLRVALLGPVSEAAQPDIRAYALNAASVRLLASLRVWEAMPADTRTAVHEMHVEGDAPGASIEFSAWQLAAPELAWIAEAAELDRALRSAVRFAPHVSVVDAPVPAALQVLADGQSGRTTRHPYGQRAIAARLSVDRHHAGLARQWFRSPDVLALLPLDRPRPGHGLALVWSMPEAEADRVTALPESDFTQALNAATQGAAGTLALASERATWPLSMALADPVHGPGWVLVGDAAHVVHPLAGQGLNLGLGDVAVLADVLAAREPWRPVGDPRLLARYTRRRSVAVRAMLGATDALLHLFASPHPFIKELRNRGLSLVDRVGPLKRLLATRAIGQ